MVGCGGETPLTTAGRTHTYRLLFTLLRPAKPASNGSGANHDAVLPPARYT